MDTDLRCDQSTVVNIRKAREARAAVQQGDEYSSPAPHLSETPYMAIGSAAPEHYRALAAT